MYKKNHMNRNSAREEMLRGQVIYQEWNPKSVIKNYVHGEETAYVLNVI